MSPTHAAQRWIAYQLLLGLAQAHARGVCHGDVRPENVVLASWDWAWLVDWAPYKPVLLPADNPADFSLYFDTSGRRRCYLAPERLYDPAAVGGPGPGEVAAAQLTPAMVRAGGVIAARLLAPGGAGRSGASTVPPRLHTPSWPPHLLSTPRYTPTGRVFTGLPAGRALPGRPAPLRLLTTAGLPRRWWCQRRCQRRRGWGCRRPAGSSGQGARQRARHAGAHGAGGCVLTGGWCVPGRSGI